MSFPGKDFQNNTLEEIYGIERAYYAGEDNSTDESIINSTTFEEYVEIIKKIIMRDNTECQPGIECKCEIIEREDHHILLWNEAGEFNQYINWLKYLINIFFKPWGILLDGEIKWTGKDPEDIGQIVVTNNLVEIYNSRVG
jgi:hypothetical protein